MGGRARLHLRRLGVISDRAAQRLWEPKLLDRQPGNLRGIADAGLSNLDDLLGDKLFQRIVVVF